MSERKKPKCPFVLFEKDGFDYRAVVVGTIGVEDPRCMLSIERRAYNSMNELYWAPVTDWSYDNIRAPERILERLAYALHYGIYDAFDEND